MGTFYEQAERPSEDHLNALREKFPAHFKSLKFTCPPRDAFPQTHLVYRLCVSEDSLCSDDFVPTYLESPQPELRTNASSYSVSFMETTKKIEQLLASPKHSNKHVVQGTIKKKYGFMKRSTNGQHCDLWLYEDSRPWLDFTEKDDTEN